MTTNAAAVLAHELPRTPRDRAFELFTAELPRMLELLRSLGPEDWNQPTDCARWTVHGIVAHLVGSFEGAINPLVAMRRMRRGRRRYPELVKLDAYNEVQVDERRATNPAELVEDYARLGPRAARAARRMPRPLRRITVDGGMPGVPALSLGYLADVIALRAAWMHRVDICQATGRPFVVGTADHEVVEQVVRDLAVDWRGPTVLLELTGDAGGRWQLGAGQSCASVRADAVEYMRTLAGRHDEPVLQVTTGDPAARSALAAARVPF